MKGLFLFLALYSGMCWAHQIQLVSQHVKLNKQHESGYLADVIAKAVVSKEFTLGLEGTYLERFDIYDSRGGISLGYRPNDSLSFEFKYNHGEDVILLPHDQYSFNMYHTLAPGFSPFLTLRNSLYTVAHVRTVNLGMEIEKLRNIIIIPQIMAGHASFNTENDSEDLHNYGLRVVYYEENNYSFYLFGYKGVEAAQGIIGQSSTVVDTLTGGVGASYYFIPKLKTELVFDYTDFDQYNNQFLTTTLNLAWTF